MQEEEVEIGGNVANNPMVPPDIGDERPLDNDIFKAGKDLGLIICYLFRLRKRSRLYFWSGFKKIICEAHNFVLEAINKHKKYTII